MTHQILRNPALTAIAAVLALSSTPLLAQAADPAAASPAPVAADPAPLAVGTSPVAPVTDSAIAAPADPLEATSNAPAKSVKRTTRTVSKPAPVARATASHTAPIARAAKTAVAAAPPLAATMTPAPVEPVQPVAAMPTEPVAPVAMSRTSVTPTDETLPIVAGGLGALALAGAGFAVSRRRRRRADDELALADEPVVEPAVVAPVAAEPIVRAPVMARAPAPAVPLATNHDSVRVAAAHAGPSDDNPSLSLKKRIKRAHALDQMERNGHLVPNAAPAQAAPRQPSVSTWARPAAPGLMFGRQPAPTPAFQN